ncbi:uncharacterized protein LOC111053300 isoform X4 [Nilaparvata lugens]|uniref:uncharacterized protein LOC111053300 isoform X4 n=1 Tax=Nilaparvata lugens TaxID=108931 RepID=UPI00193DA762|nr:uncharacterized protein LOC111053300 isoform X4 [Nilaparvata lugens]
MAVEFDFDHLLQLDALEEEGRKELLALFENLDEGVTQNNNAAHKEKNSDKSDEEVIDILELFKDIDIESINRLGNCSNDDGELSVSENKPNYKGTHTTIEKEKSDKSDGNHCDIFNNLDHNTYSKQENSSKHQNHLKESHATTEEENSPESDGNKIDIIEFFNNLDQNTDIEQENCSNSIEEITVSGNNQNYVPTPCQRCEAQGKTYMKELMFLNQKQAFYACKNASCVEEDNIRVIKSNFWEKQLNADDLERLNLPGELLDYMPVITNSDAKRIANIAQYREELQEKQVADVLGGIYWKLEGTIPAGLLTCAAPSKSKYSLDEVSDIEVERIIAILNSIDRGKILAGKNTGKTAAQNNPKESSSCHMSNHSSSSRKSQELPLTEDNVQSPGKRETDRRNNLSSKKKADNNKKPAYKKKATYKKKAAYLETYHPNSGRPLSRKPVYISDKKKKKILARHIKDIEILSKKYDL